MPAEVPPPQADVPSEPALPSPGPLKAVAAIGASAGGLEALEAFFSHVPPETGIAYVVVMHLNPTQRGMLPELLGRAARIPVREIEEGDELRPDMVFVRPSNADLRLDHGRFSLVPLPEGPRPPMSIDGFFAALAADQDGRAVGIVLSGAGTDGTLGLRVIKERTGMVMVQDPATAQFDGMPSSAIATGLADYIAPPAELPRMLVEYVRFFAEVPSREPSPDEVFAKALERLLVLVRARTGQDFSQYKQSTIRRRVQRRMGVHQLARVEDYIRYLQENPHEVEVLARELLIGVTRFFRDPEAWETLQRQVLPPLVAEKPFGSTVRAWSVGCSTGEEAFTLAIVLREALSDAGRLGEVTVQVFGTDVDAEAIATARQGVYPENIAADVPEAMLERYFVHEEGRYRVRSEVRESVIFAPQNVILDALFTHLDLVVCRNLLIYLTPDLQKRLLPLFHYALSRGGLLFLGTAESIGGFHTLFRTRDGRWKIYQRREVGAVPLPLPIETVPARGSRGGPAAAPVTGRQPAPAAAAQEWLIGRYAPPAVVANEAGEILYFHGRTGRYLEPRPGRASLNVHVMAREPFRATLDAAFAAAVEGRATVTAPSVQADAHGPAVRITVQPLTGTAGRPGLYGVSFEDVPAEASSSPGNGEPAPPPAVDLQPELDWTRARLRRTVEEGQASQEELKSMNEELQSMNEELQSTNEELTTSREELQSLNEELLTVNAELREKVEAVTRANDDMVNLLSSTQLAILFLDNDLRVRRFTGPVARIVGLRQGDEGRPITDFEIRVRDGRLVEDLREVLKTLQARERQIETTDGGWYLMRALPYRTSGDRIDGVVVTFVDIGQLHALEGSLRDAEALVRVVAELVPGPALVFSGDRVRLANRAFVEAFGAGIMRGGAVPGWLAEPLGRLVADGAGETEVAPPGGGPHLRAAARPFPGGLTLVTLGPVGAPMGVAP